MLSSRKVCKTVSATFDGDMNSLMSIINCVHNDHYLNIKLYFLLTVQFSVHANRKRFELKFPDAWTEK